MSGSTADGPSGPLSPGETFANSHKPDPAPSPGGEGAFATVPTLASSSVTATGATLTISGYANTGGWHYQYTSPSGGVCSSTAVTGSSTTVTLTANTSYTFAAYSDSACTTLLATAASFTTPQQPVSVSNLSESDTGTYTVGPNSAHAQEFTTGANTGGYTLSSVQLEFDAVIGASDVTVTLRARQSNGQPATTALATLSGTAATGASTFTCSTGCDLSASTSYFVYAVASGTNSAYVRFTASDTETGASGWSITNASRYQQGAWALYPGGYSLQIKVTATPK